MNDKRISYRQLEKQVKNGKELLMRVTRRIKQKDDVIESLNAQIKSAQAYMKVLIGEGKTITLSKEDITKALQTTMLKAYESEDKKNIIIEVLKYDDRRTNDRENDKEEGSDVQQQNCE